MIRVVSRQGIEEYYLFDTICDFIASDPCIRWENVVAIIEEE